ncbi:MAG: quinone-interacting membrane-bound oxidoreductase complex subunit QmoC, partial [Candidatus Nealsonbacteria bacterium]|nr:quinone-interacting membrane-bound oxidoreductase complex subunit QmoC [Candidatus Nealsonbacteria bacterium]
SDPYLVKPDRDFLHRVLDSGGEDLKKCMQCATCSVVCKLSTGKKAFPRQEMIYAQWGLKDRLTADPNVWLCHQCNDCSTKCPRGARPGDVLAAVRQQCVEHYAVPKALGLLANRVKYLPLMLAVPAVLLVVALLLKNPIYNAAEGVLHYLHHPGFYSDLYPHWLLIGFYSTFWGLACLGALVGLVRFWKAMKAADEAAGGYTPVLGVVPSFVRTLTTIFRHDKFGMCESHASRRLAHLGAFYGFVALFLVSVWAVVALYMINPFIEGHDNDLVYPFAIWNPWKILANLGAIVLIAGAAKAIIDRKTRQRTEDSGGGTEFDRIFVWLLLGVGVTGLATELIRYVAEPADVAGLTYFAYTVYFVHLVLVFDLLVYLPFSKLAHMLYRTVAMVYAEHTGRSAAAVKKT